MSLIGRLGKTSAAPAAAGNIIGAPPRKMRISRRLMGSLSERANLTCCCSAVLCVASMPLDVRLGQKRTWIGTVLMSALPPKAGVKFAHQSACLHERLGLPVSQLQS